MLSNGDGTLSPGTVRNENGRAAVCFVRLGDLLQWAGNVGCGNCKGHNELITVRPARFLTVRGEGQHRRSRCGTAADGGRLYICAIVAGRGDAVAREFRTDVSGGEFFIVSAAAASAHGIGCEEAKFGANAGAAEFGCARLTS